MDVMDSISCDAASVHPLVHSAPTLPNLPDRPALRRIPHLHNDLPLLQKQDSSYDYDPIASDSNPIPPSREFSYGFLSYLVSLPLALDQASGFLNNTKGLVMYALIHNGRKQNIMACRTSLPAKAHPAIGGISGV